MSSRASRPRPRPTSTRSRRQRLAAGAVLATTSLLGTYLAAIRPQPTYAAPNTGTEQGQGLVGSANVSANSLTLPTCGQADDTVSNEGDLRAAILASDDTSVICIDGKITLTADLPTLDDTSVTLIGATDDSTAHGIDGSNTHRGFVANFTAAPDDSLIISSLTIENTYSSTGNGAAVTSSGNVTVANSTFSGNYAKGGAGAAIFVSGDKSVIVSGSTFTGNKAKDSGGAIYAYQLNAGAISVTDSSFTNNAAGVTGQSESGGAVYSNWGDITIEDSDFATNQATSRGGAVAARNQGATVTVRGTSTFTGNKATSATNASYGGAIYSYGDLAVEEATFTQNVAADLGQSGNGGALFIHYGIVTVSDSTFDRNEAKNYGGAVHARYTYQQPSSISRSTFVGNEAVVDKGGAVFIGYGPLDVENSTFTGNTSGDSGSAIYGYEGYADVTVDFSTITSNTSGSTGAFAAAVVTGSNYTEDLSVTNSILYNNVDNNGDERDLSAGGNLSVSFSLLTSATSFYAAGTVTDSELLYGDPLLGSLGNNGGPTQTMLPAANSPVIGKADPTGAPSFDQRGIGFPRTTDGLAAMGAVQVGSVTPPTPPPPVFPPSAPLNVTGTAGDASATITWTAPTSAGSFPITDYQAVLSPGGATCLVQAPAVSCTITGLTNGTEYTATARALNGAGWGPYSAPSDPFTPENPTPPVTKTIVIIGTRGTVDGKPGVYANGETTGLVGATVQARVKLAGQLEYRNGSTRVVQPDGSFQWQRKTGKKVYVYFMADDGDTRSNRVIIAAR